jgi:hypothetical protein
MERMREGTMRSVDLVILPVAAATIVVQDRRRNWR